MTLSLEHGTAPPFISTMLGGKGHFSLACQSELQKQMTPYFFFVEISTQPVLKCKRIFALAESSRNTLREMPSNLTEQ